jgi:hypothetical protein
VPVEIDGPSAVDADASAETHATDDAAQPASRAEAREVARARPPRRALAWLGAAAAALALVCVAAVLQFRRADRPAPLLASVVIDLPTSGTPERIAGDLCPTAVTSSSAFT